MVMDGDGGCVYHLVLSKSSSKEMNRRDRIKHRQTVLSDAMQVYIDRVTGKRNPARIENTREYVKYRRNKLADG